MFGEDNKVIFNFEAIHPDVLEYFNHIMTALFNKGGESNNRMYKELWFIEDTIGVKRGTLYASIQRHYRDSSRLEILRELESKLEKMQLVINN